jgi:DNA invertase Pin-like site-specific DNA recombinase
MKDNGQPLVPYLRQSRAKERTISIEEQRRDVRTWAKAAGVPLAPEVVEQNVSGSKPWRERGIGDAIAACERGEASGVIVAWQDRLSREHELATAEVWEALEQAGARLVCAAEGMDTATGDHEMTFAIKAAIAREQWKRYRANWEGARRNGIESGAYPTKTPFGYVRGEGARLIICDEAAAIVRRIFRLRAEGRGIAEIGRALEGARSPQGGPSWSHSTIAQILRNRVYLGEQPHGEFVKLNAHEALVSEAEFSAAQVAKPLRTPEPRAHSAGALAVGIARCAGCGHTLKIVTGWNGALRYYCKGPYASGPCPARCLVRVDELDPYVERWFLSAIKDNVRVASAVRANRRAIQTQRKLEEAEEQVLAFVKFADVLEADHFQAGYEEKRRTLELAKLEHAEALGEKRLYADLPSGDLLATWPQLSVQRRRQLLAAFVDRINVSRGRGSVAKRVQFVRDGVVIPKQVGKLIAALA